MKEVLKIFIRISSVRINLCLFYRLWKKKSAIEFNISRKTLRTAGVETFEKSYVKENKVKFYESAFTCHIVEWSFLSVVLYQWFYQNLKLFLFG